MPEQESLQLTVFLSRWTGGDEEALADLLPLVYTELRQLASFHLLKERKNHTLQPTALVHEAWMRLLSSAPGTVDCRTHFFAAAAQVMRRILVEHARRRQAKKRVGEAKRITLELDETPDEGTPIDFLDVHRALNDLALISEDQAKVVEMRYFGGLTIDEIARLKSVSASTVERQWTAARLWLRRRLESYATGR